MASVKINLIVESIGLLLMLLAAVGRLRITAKGLVVE